jgi:hypothetical protein
MLSSFELKNSNAAFSDKVYIHFELWNTLVVIQFRYIQYINN